MNHLVFSAVFVVAVIVSLYLGRNSIWRRSEAGAVNPESKKTVPWRIVRGIAFVGLINFVLFVAGTFYLGGDALNGYHRGVHYFLGLHGNGPFTEVSRSVFLYSEWHALIMIGNFAVFFAAALIFRIKIFPPRQ